MGDEVIGTEITVIFNDCVRKEFKGLEFCCFCYRCEGFDVGTLVGEEGQNYDRYIVEIYASVYSKLSIKYTEKTTRTSAHTLFTTAHKYMYYYVYTVCLTAILLPITPGTSAEWPESTLVSSMYLSTVTARRSLPPS